MTEKELLSEVKCGNYRGIYESENGVTQYDWGKYDYSVSKEQQSPDYKELYRAVTVLNKKSNTHFAYVEYGDKFNSVYVCTYKAVCENSDLYEKIYRNDKPIIDKINLAGFFNEVVDNKLKAELKEKNKLKSDAKKISKKLGFEVTDEVYKRTFKLTQKGFADYGYEVKFYCNWDSLKKFDTAKELFAHLISPEFIRDFMREGTNICKATVYLKTNYINLELYRGGGTPHLLVGTFLSHCPVNEQETTLKVLIEQFSKLYLSLINSAK